MTNEELEVKTADTAIRYRKLGPRLFHSLVRYEQDLGPRSGSSSREVTVNGATWSVVYGGKIQGKTEVRQGDRGIPLKPYFFLPPFSIIEMGFEHLRVEYQGLVSDGPCWDTWPTEPIMFDSDAIFNPTSIEDVDSLLNARRNEISISRANDPDQLARSAREMIHRCYDSNCSISDIALELDVDHATLTKSFTKGFGIPPVKYRNILRVHDSIRHLLFGKASATGAAFEVGFEDLSRFNKNFKKIMEAVPSQFSFRSSLELGTEQSDQGPLR